MVLPAAVLERLMFLRRKLEIPDEDRVIERALRLLDLITCAVDLEGGQILVKHKDGSLQILRS